MRPVDADALYQAALDAFYRADLGHEEYDAIINFLDVAPVINPDNLIPHGRWIETEEGTYCSECNKSPVQVGNFQIANFIAPYCPNCGVKMDKDVEGNGKETDWSKGEELGEANVPGDDRA